MVQIVLGEEFVHDLVDWCAVQKLGSGSTNCVSLCHVDKTRAQSLVTAMVWLSKSTFVCVAADVCTDYTVMHVFG